MEENCFYPWKEYKQFTNLDDVGEITEAARPWNNGANSSLLPGTGPYGPLEHFKGQGDYDPHATPPCSPGGGGGGGPGCEFYDSVPDTLFLIITDLVNNPEGPILGIGDTFTLQRVSPGVNRWEGTTVLYPGTFCEVHWIMECIGGTLFCSINESNGLGARTLEESSPFKAEWIGFVSPHAGFCPGDSEYISLKVVE